MTSRRRYAPCQVLSKTAAPPAHPAVVIQRGAVCIKRKTAASLVHPAVVIQRGAVCIKRKTAASPVHPAG
ncbi:MAG: hypothetical protein ACI30M_03675 [Muribaculaceae bacterium]